MKIVKEKKEEMKIDDKQDLINQVLYGLTPMLTTKKISLIIKN